MEYTLAHISDLDKILVLDEIHGTELDRKNEVIRAIEDGSCYLIQDANMGVGY